MKKAGDDFVMEHQGRAQPSDRSVQSVGRYNLKKVVSIGSTDVLFEAEEPFEEGGGRKLALYLPVQDLQEDEDFRTAYLADCARARFISHPYLLSTADSGLHRAMAWRTAEWIDGWSLGEIMRRARSAGASVDAREIASIGLQIAEAGAHLSEAVDGSGQPLNLFHGQISPDRVFLSRGGYPKLVGLPIQHRELNARVVALQKRVPPEELAPEQLRDNVLTAQTDVYLCALLLNTLAAGGNPLRRRSYAETAGAVLEGRGAGRGLERLPKALQALIKRSLSVSLDHRPPNLKSFARELTPILDQLGGSVSPEHWRGRLSRLFGSSRAAMNPLRFSAATEAAQALLRQLEPTLAPVAPVVPPPSVALTEPASMSIEEVPESMPEKKTPFALYLVAGLGLIATVALAVVLSRSDTPTVEVAALEAPAEGDIQLYLDEAERLLSLKRYNQALKMVERAEAFESGDARSVIQISNLYYQIQRDSWLAQGQLAASTGDEDAARDFALKILEQDPADVDALALLSTQTPDVVSKAEVEAPRRSAPARSAPARARKSAAPARATLSVDANLEGTLFIDGRQVGVTPLSDLEVKPGRHVVQLRREGYESVVRTVEFDDDGHVDMFLSLQAAAPAESEPITASEVARTLSQAPETRSAPVESAPVESAPVETAPAEEPAVAALNEPDAEPSEGSRSQRAALALSDSIGLPASAEPDPLAAFVKLDDLAAVESVLRAAEQEAIERGVPKGIASGTTSQLLRSLQKSDPGSGEYTLNPRAISDQIVVGYQSGMTRAAISGNLRRTEGQ